MNKNREKMRGDPTRLLSSAVDEAVGIIARRIEDGLKPDGTPDKIDVAALRLRLGYTQVEFAAYFRVSVGTLRNWEQGRRKPHGAARTLLDLIAYNPSSIEENTNTQVTAAEPIAPAPEKPHHSGRMVDVHVGQRIRMCRWMRGMTQTQLGDLVGIEFQQVQKYEIGESRVNAGRMWDIAGALEMPIASFFEGLNDQVPESDEAKGNLLTDKEALELVRAYYAMPENQRGRVFDLVRKLSKVA